MKMPFRRSDTDDTLSSAQSALAQVEQSIAALLTEREAKLAEATGDYLAEVGRIDREIATLRANLVVHQDRIQAMTRRQRMLDASRREKQKAAFLTDISGRLERRRDAAAKVDAALAQLSAAFAELAAADDHVFAAWPDVLPPAGLFSYLRALTIEALSSRLMPRSPLRAGLVRTVAEHSPFDLAAMVTDHDGELLEELRKAPIPEAETEAAA